MKTNQRKTVSSIAAECGVSAMTVSRALRNDVKVKDDTRRQIITVAERLGYIRAPRMGRPAQPGPGQAVRFQLIAGTIGRSMAVFHSQLLTSIEQQLAKCGHECVIRTCNGNYQQFIQLLENLRCSNAEATILVGSFLPEQLTALLDAAPDAILLDNPGDPAVEISHNAFTFDNVEAARIAVRHLLDCGRGRILLLSGTPNHFFSRDIEQGYRDVMFARKLKIDENLILHADFSAESAHDVIADALASGVQFDAVFTNDEMASGVYRALFECGMKIPQNIAVCGCDGLPVGMHLFPRLTTVVLNYDELGRMAVEYMLNADRNRRTPHRVQLLPSLEMRESTG